MYTASAGAVPASTQKEVARVTGWELHMLRDCSRAYEFSQLSLRRQESKAIDFLKGVFSRVKTLLISKSSLEDVSTLVHELFANYQEDWFDSQAEYQYRKERDEEKVLRLVRYIFQQGYDVLMEDVPVSLEFGTSMLRVNTRAFNQILDSVDLVLGKDGLRVAVTICFGKPEYSYQARREEDWVENSVELLSTYLGLAYRFRGNRLVVERWYLSNKDDTASKLVSSFNHRQGKNIISYDYSELAEKEVQQRFLNALLKLKKADACKECRFSEICQMNRSVRMDERVESKASGAVDVIFTPAQEEVVSHVDGPMCAIAVPGAGKTFCLVHRLVNLIQEGVEPSHVLFITFTNLAADEIRQRVSAMLEELGYDGRGPVVTTFNAFGFNILRENPIFLGKRVKLANAVDRYHLIDNVLKEVPRIQGMAYTNMKEEHGIIRKLDKMFQDIEVKGVDWFLAEYSATRDAEGILRAYQKYDMLYRKEGYITFDQQISLCRDLFLKYPNIQKKYAERLEYIMVDEFQDSCKEQVELLYGLAHYHNNLVVVGDDDQSIYGWRGSSNEFMLNFKVDFPGARIVYMQDNFRSNGKILDACGALIRANSDRYVKELVARGADGEAPLYLKNADSSSLVGVVRKLVEEGYRPGDIAVLSRYNKRCTEAAKALEEHFAVSAGKDYLIEDTVFRAVRDVLSLYYDGLDQDEVFYRFFAYHNQERVLQKVVKGASLYQNQLMQESMKEIRCDADCLNYYRSQKDVDAFGKEGYRLVSCFAGIQNSRTIEEALGRITQSLYGFKKHPVISRLKEMAGEKALLSMQELYQLMNDMVLYGSDDRVGYTETANAVNVMTVHDSKGKEFRAVILYAVEDYEEAPEEIRVLYVGMTRAKQRLVMMESPYALCEVYSYIKEYVNTCV